MNKENEYFEGIEATIYEAPKDAIFKVYFNSDLSNHPKDEKVKCIATYHSRPYNQ